MYVCVAVVACAFGANPVPICDVLSWVYTGKEEDAIVYSVNFKEVGRGIRALETCIGILEGSPARQLIISPGPAGPRLPSSKSGLSERLAKLCAARGVAYIDGVPSGRACIVVLTHKGGTLQAVINGKEGDPFRDGSIVKRVVENDGLVLLVCDASVFSPSSNVVREAERVQNLCRSGVGRFVRIDVQAEKIGRSALPEDERE